MPIIINDLQAYITYPQVNNGVPVFVGPNFSPLSILTTDVGSKDVGALFTVSQGTMTFTNIGALPSGVTFNNGVYSWAGAQVQGTSSMITRATGSLAPSTPTDFAWTLIINPPSGNPPVFSGPITDQTYIDNTGTKTFDSSTYATGETSMSVVGLPVTGITFNTGTGIFTINSGTAAIGTYPFTVTYTNGFGSTQSNQFNIIIASPPSNRIYIPGIYIAISYSQRGVGGGDSLSTDPSPSFSYSAGNTSNPLTITGSFSANIGSIPGGSTGTGTSSGCNDGTGTGGHTLSRNGTGPCVDFENIGSPKIVGARTQGLVVRYPWNDIELSKNNYYFGQMDADLAQCIALGVLFFPLIVQKTFTAGEANGGNITSGPGAGATGNCMPGYLVNFCSPGTGPLGGSGTGGTTCWRWDMTNISPRMVALIKAIGNRYDLCTNFGGIATQETATASADSVASGYTYASTPVNNYPIAYFNALKAEADACLAANPHGRQLAFQNFASGSGAARMLDDYAAYLVSLGAILAGPDLVLGGSVYNSCYTSGNNLAGRYWGYHHGNITLASGAVFGAGTGPTGCSIQKAEWTGISPSFKGANPPVIIWTVQNTFDYGVSAASDHSSVSQKYTANSTIVQATNPDYLSLDIVIVDWHQEGTAGPQQFAPDGIALIKNNPSPFGSWVP